MKISARNQLKGTVEKVEKGAVNSIVTLKIGSQKVTATISNSAVEDLGLTEGKEACAIIKATEVMIGLGELNISARNKFNGEICKIEKGAVNAIVALKQDDGTVITATISNNAVEDLGLEVGKKAVAVVKATSVLVACCC